MIRQFFLIICVLLVVFSSSGGHATTIDETQIDVKTREIAKTLRCTVCQTENIWESGAPLAHQMREAVRERVIQGQSAEEIIKYFQIQGYLSRSTYSHQEIEEVQPDPKQRANAD